MISSFLLLYIGFVQIAKLKGIYLKQLEVVKPLIFILLGNDNKTKNFNEPRLCIRKYFPEKKCFIFGYPANCNDPICLEQLQEEDLNPKFRKQVADFCCYILSHSKAKTLSGGITVNGPRESPFLFPYPDSPTAHCRQQKWEARGLLLTNTEFNDAKENTPQGHHIVNFTYELKVFLVLSNIHISQMNQENELESNPGVVNFSMNFSTPF